MNISKRQNLNDYRITTDNNNQPVKHYSFTDVRSFLSVGFSTIFTACSQVNCKSGISVGDKVYFKVNNEYGINHLGRADESCGSCEDVAEVLGFYALRNLARTLGRDSILKTTPYEFAEYSHERFFDLISQKSGGFIDSDRFYGCISKNCISKDAEIIRGDNLLSLIVSNGQVTASGNNTLYNYSTALNEFATQSNSIGQETLIHPISSRYLANTMFWDYFFLNSDRHCKNINFQRVPIGNHKFLLEPLAIIDNGGGLCMQFNNCKKLYSSITGSINNNVQNFANPFNPFNVPYDFYVGKDAYPDGELKSLYDDMKYREQMVVLLSTSKTLYTDFANMYKNLNFEQAVESMHEELSFNRNFLPNLAEVATMALRTKQAEISASMASFMGETFNIEVFNENPNYYLDKFAALVQDDTCNLHIATNEEVSQFDEMLFSNFGFVSQHNMCETLPQVNETIQLSEEELLACEISQTFTTEEELPEIASDSSEQEVLSQFSSEDKTMIETSGILTPYKPTEVELLPIEQN